MAGRLSDGDCDSACWWARRARARRLPLYVWLPDAMEGPTPVSALIHAATMVTAGVYMIARTHFIFDRSPFALAVVAIVGAATALFAATHRAGADGHQAGAGLLDRVAAGIHVPGVRRGGVFGGDLSPDDACVLQGAALPRGRFGDSRAGRRTGYAPDGRTAEEHAGHVLDDAGGGVCDRRHFSFRGILQQGRDSFEVLRSPGRRRTLWFVGLVTAILTSFYMFRLWYMTFLGKSRAPAHGDAHGHAPHESPWIMLGPLVILALLSLTGGWMGWPEALHGSNCVWTFS